MGKEIFQVLVIPLTITVNSVSLVSDVTDVCAHSECSMCTM